MRQDRKCSICGFVIHGDDNLYDNRKKRHEEHHSEIGASKNVSLGKVQWMAVW